MMNDHTRRFYPILRLKIIIIMAVMLRSVPFLAKTLQIVFVNQLILAMAAAQIQQSFSRRHTRELTRLHPRLASSFVQSPY